MSNSPLSQRSPSRSRVLATAATAPALKSRTCRFCFKGFSKAEHLTRHERSHTKERPYHCSKCGKSYSRNDTLIRHRRVHERVVSGPEKVVSGPEAFSENDDSTSPNRADDAAATLVDLQSTVGCQNPDGPAIPSPDTAMLETTGYSANQGDSPEAAWMDRNLNMDFSTDRLLDPALHQYPRGSPSEDIDYSSQMELWNLQNDAFPPWHIGEDFDIEAFNMSLLSPPTIEGFPWHSQSSAIQPDDILDPRSDNQNPGALSTNDIQSLWITRADDYSWKNEGNASYSVAPTRSITPTAESLSASKVDERYRDDLLQRLQPRWKEDPLPSTEFLNLALQLFFTKFNPVFPIIHAPTFRPSNENSLLLLSICSVGSLFMGSTAATTQGSKIFERLNKVILASWENIITRKASERISLVQASVLGQTFAYLSGNPKYLATVQVFHGTVIAFSRRCGMFNTVRSIPTLGNESPQELEAAWNTWARWEEMTRTALALYVHDSQLASTFHHDPVLRHNAIRISVAANDALFAASSAAQWANLVRLSTPDQSILSSHLHVNQPEHCCFTPLPSELACKNSSFSCYVLLHGIGAAVQECNAAGQRNPSEIKKHQDALICWYQAYEATRSTRGPDSLCQMILCHEIFMSLLVDYNELERAIGRDGPSESAEALKYVKRWSSSIEATRCVIHATLIHRQISSMRVDSEPAIHVPRSMFLAAIAWYCYIQFDQGDTILPQLSDIPETKAFNIDPLQLLFESSGFKKEKSKLTESGPLCGLTDMLYRLGHWGIARRFARIMRLLIHGDSDNHLMDSA